MTPTTPAELITEILKEADTHRHWFHGDRVEAMREVIALASSTPDTAPATPDALSGQDSVGTTASAPAADAWQPPAHWPTDTAPGQHKAQEGVWTLTAPDGHTWQADSPLRVVAKESNERVPPEVALARLGAAIAEPPTKSGTDSPAVRAPSQGAVAWMDEQGSVILAETRRKFLEADPNGTAANSYPIALYTAPPAEAPELVRALRDAQAVMRVYFQPHALLDLQNAEKVLARIDAILAKFPPVDEMG